MLLPLQNVKILGKLESGHALLDVQLSYANNDGNPIECTFEFPIEKATIVTKLIAQIDDKVVEAKIQTKSSAKEKYDDAISSGNAAVFGELKSKQKEEAIVLMLGNLLPGQTAVINLQLIQTLKITNGAFDF